ncbi:MAG: ATP-binding cassette domain-containing protein [Chitinophagaceae bacterium]|nr:ATP-binding cassette domain-containing protein [Chitinophagaceae bacterium]MBK8786074.1 ATP-binding cassette domain-containing protein [Chitinophagaceae bacterium]MBK9485371.1 ATP-binding cassette domain-containing protein [Chitinophagaceae bacterium]
MPKTATPLSKILNLVKLERKEITAVYFYAILNGLIQLSLPLGVQAIIGFVMGASMRASLIVLIALVVTGVLIAGILQINQMKIIEKIQQKLFVRYSFAFATHIPKLDLKKNDKFYLPELVNRFFDIPILQKSLSKILLDIPTASIQIVFGLALLAFYHPAFIFFGIFLITLLWLIIRYSGNRGLQTSLDESTYKYKVAGWLEESARVIKSIKLAKSNDLHLQKTDEEVTGYLHARNSHFKILLLQYHVLVLFKTVITAAMLIVGTILLVNQQLNIGQFIAAEIIILLVLNSVEKLIMNLGTVYDTLTSIEKISSLTDKPAEENGSVQLAPADQGLQVEMQQLSFSYNDEKEILIDVSLKINSGDKVCIQGKDSSGKSTLLRLMAGAYTDFKGALLLDDVPVGNYNLDSVRSQIGVLLNQQDIFNGTVWENIALGNEHISRQAVNDIAVKVGLTDFISTLKKGYDTLLDPAGKRLPRNVIHKILLTRALAAKPRLLLLEDPWMSTEDSYRQQIIQMLNDIANTTIVVVSNDEEFTKQCDKVFIMKEHKIIKTK